MFCGHGLELFGSRNSTDTDWTHLVQETVPDSCSHANKLVGCRQNTAIPS